jgi:phage terminase large subunit
VDQTLYVDREVYRVGCKIEDTPALFDMLDNKQARQWPITADSARPETIAHMRDHGYPRMVPAKKGADSVKEGVEFLKNYDIVVHPDCRNTVDELAKYSYLIDKKTEQVLPKLSDKKNHVIDALRYAVESLRRAAEPPTINVLHIPAPDIEKIW